MYTLFAWDCSSIGQSTALSRRKLRVRAPSVPTDPNTIKKIHQFISSFSLKGRTNSRISFPLGMLSYFIYLFFPFTFLIKEIWEFPFIQLVPIERRKAYVNQYNYWQKHIQDSKRYRTESVFFDYSRSVLCNRVLYVSSRTYKIKFNIVTLI